RNEDLGKKAVEELKKEGCFPKFHQLDITDKSSIDKLKSFLQSTYGGLDILVNNAGIAYKAASTAPFSEQAEVTIRTNFTATLDVCNALFPLLRPHARQLNDKDDIICCPGYVVTDMSSHKGTKTIDQGADTPLYLAMLPPNTKSPKARNEDLGKKAVEDLKKEGCSSKFHQLDITDKSSIDKLKSFLQSTYGGLDILVNNAGIAYKAASTAPFSEQAEVTIRTNFTATLDVCNALFPLLRPHARVVNVSSMVSEMAIKKCSSDMQKRFKDPNLTMNQLCDLIKKFVTDAKTGDHQKSGFPDSSYGMSKVGITCCPGYVDTDMTSHKGHKTIDQGADTPLYLAMLPPNTKSPK
ncbi:hypothetical protein KUTeg_024991, partial [Tegillarca granosa]